jgi:hypothetical protein
MNSLDNEQVQLPETLQRIQRNIDKLQHRLANAEIMSRCTPVDSNHRKVIDSYKQSVELYKVQIKLERQLYAEYLQKRDFVFKRVV